MFKKCLSTIFLLILCGLAVPASAAPEVGMVTVQAEGQAAVVNGDLVNAENEATEDALVEAVKKVFGTVIDSTLYVENELVLDHFITTRTNGYVRDYVVLDRRVDEKGICRVTIQADVSLQGVKEDVREIFPSERVSVSVRESGVGLAVSQGYVENVVMERILSLGEHFIVNRGDNENKFDTSSTDVAVSGDIRVTFGQDLGKQYDALDGMISAHAVGTIKIFYSDTQEVVCEKAFGPVKGFGTESMAGKDALKVLTPDIADFVSACLSTPRSYYVEIQAMNVPDFPSFERIRNILKANRWVSDITTVTEYSPKISTFRVGYAGHCVEYLGNFLSRDACIQVVSMTKRKIVLEYDCGSNLAYKLHR